MVFIMEAPRELGISEEERVVINAAATAGETARVPHYPDPVGFSHKKESLIIPTVLGIGVFVAVRVLDPELTTTLTNFTNSLIERV